MHIVDGVLSTPVLVVGAAATVAGVAVSLSKLDTDTLPRVGVLSAVFFIASLIHVPIGPTSVHLILNGLIGIVLGWAAFPALVIALLLQAVFFGFGGLTVLGINTVNIALPAVACYFLFGTLLRSGIPGRAFLAGALAGAGSIALTCFMVGLSLAATGESFLPAAKAVFFAHIPVMIIEGFLTGAAANLLCRVKPELLEFNLVKARHA